MKKDQRIEELLHENRSLRDRYGALQCERLLSINEVTEAKEELQKQKEKYARLLERYISMMEKVATDGRN